MGDAIRGLRQVAQHAADLPRVTAFYRDVVGLRHIVTFDPPGLVFFDLDGGTRLLFEQAAPPALLYLEVDDIEAATARLVAAGVQLEGPPHLIYRDDDGAFGAVGMEEWMVFFRDSEGNLVALAEGRRA